MTSLHWWVAALALVAIGELGLIYLLLALVDRQRMAVRLALEQLEAAEAANRARPLPFHAGVQSVRPDLPRPKGP